MQLLKRKEKVQCGSCGNMHVRQHAARHHKSCQADINFCPDFKYFTKSKKWIITWPRSMPHQFLSTLEAWKLSGGVVETCMFVNMQLDTTKVVKQRLSFVLILSISLKARNELSHGQEAYLINFQAINGLFVLREWVFELLLSLTTSEKRTWGETTEAKWYGLRLEQDCGGGKGGWRENDGHWDGEWET